MADSGPRRRRLLALLPTIFASQPETSAVSTVIEAMAVSLAELDANLTRTQRDHWVKLAASDGSALERLGALLGIARLTWTETANDADGNPAKITREEAIEAYRQRLQLTARVLTQGLTTPRALLELAIATLGAEPCPRQKRHRDATLALGFPLGTLRRCPACATGRPGPCPYAGQQVLDAWITDNPPHRRVLAWDKPLRPSGQISVDNPALDEDVPELRLKAMDQAVQYPYLQNQATGEVIFYAGTIQPGEVLSLWPQVEAEETRRYISHEPVDPHVWRKQYPSGSAVLIGVDGRIKPVSADIYSLSGAKFPLANVALGAADAPRFASMEDAEGVRFADAVQISLSERGLKPVTVYRARKSGKPFAAVFSTVAPDGYSGEIRLLVAVKADGSLAGVRVLEHKETPGLGDLIDESKSRWILGFDGLSLGNPPEKQWKVKRDGGSFDQFTGATVTPRAVVEAVKNILSFFKANQEKVFFEQKQSGDMFF